MDTAAIRTMGQLLRMEAGPAMSIELLLYIRSPAVEYHRRWETTFGQLAKAGRGGRAGRPSCHFGSRAPAT
eukprot:16285945-Heterocapsa_arctica.AAC.1